MKIHSGKFVLRMPPSLHRGLVNKTRSESISLNTLCIQLIKNSLAHYPEPSVWKNVIKEKLPLLKQKFKNQLNGVVIFGSRVTGQQTDISDLDVLILLDSKYPIRRNLYTWWDQTMVFNSAVEINPQFLL